MSATAARRALAQPQRQSMGDMGPALDSRRWGMGAVTQRA